MPLAQEMFVQTRLSVSSLLPLHFVLVLNTRDNVLFKYGVEVELTVYGLLIYQVFFIFSRVHRIFFNYFFENSPFKPFKSSLLLY